MKLPFFVNLKGFPDEEPNDVVMVWGEVIGTWRVDAETRVFYEFIPERESEPVFCTPHAGALCEMIRTWRMKVKG